MKRLLLLLGILCIALPAYSQGSRVGDDRPVQSVQVPSGPIYSVANATISICNNPANGVPCTNKATTYTDITLSVPCSTSTQVVLAGSTSCVATSDQYGNWGAWVSPGTYTYTITIPNGNSIGPFILTASSGSGTSILPTVNVFTNNNTFPAGGLYIAGNVVPSTNGAFVVGDCVIVTAATPQPIFGDGGICSGGGGSGSVVASPQYQLFVQPNAGSSATAQGASGITTDSTGNNLNTIGNVAIGGPSPWIDITSPTYGARGAIINSSGTGSTTSLTVGVTTFKNGDGITIAGGGSAPAISAPAGLAVNPGFAAGLTVPDAVMTSTSTGSSTYQYVIFACDIYDGCTVPTSPVTTTAAATTLGKTTAAISTWSLTGSTLTITTTAPNNFPVGTYVHITGTSNNNLAGGWYPISTAGTTFTVNNVPQYSATTVSGTGGNAVAMAGNNLTWTASTGGTVGTLNMPWEYFICAERPGDGSYHIIGRSFPSTFFAQTSGGNFSTQFVDFGATITANPQIPWDISNANCTAGSAQNEMFTTKVSAGGGTTGLTLANSLSASVSGATVRKDDAPAFLAAAQAAQTAGGSLYAPIVSSGFIINSPVNLPYSISVLQTGGLTVNAPIIVKGSTNWSGATGIQPVPSFGFNGAPVVTCNAWPCIYVGDVPNQATGGSTFENLTFQSAVNGLEMLVDANWGMIWNKVNFYSGTGNTDNASMGLVIRPGAADYTITNSNFLGGPNQVIDQTWTPLFFTDRSHTGCCGGAGGVGTVIMNNTAWNRRGFYALTNGGDGLHFTAMGRTYSQGGITPRFVAQNTNGNVSGQIEIDNFFHDTESQATYAWICNISCSGGFGVPFHLGFANQIGQDTGTIPGQITGGGNQGIMNIVAAYSPDGTNISGSFGTVATGYGWLTSAGRLVPSQGLTLGAAFGTFMDIQPSVPTPQLSLENGAFFGNLTAPVTATRTYTLPDASGVLCLTSTCGGGGGINPPVGDIGGTTGSPTVTGLEGIPLPVLGGSTGYLYFLSGTPSVSTSASNLTTGTLPHAQLPALISTDIPNNTANTTGTAGNLAGCIGSSAGDVCYYTGSAWARLAGNASSTQYLQETSSGVPSWTTPSGAGNFTVSSLSQYQTVVGTGTTSGQGAGPGTTAYSLISNGASAYPTFQQVSLTAGVTGLLPNANLANTATTVNTQTCTLGSPCTIPFSVVGSNNSSQNGINFIASTVNAVGLTVTPSNPSSNNVKFEITGTVPGGTVTHSTGNLIQGESVVGSGASVNDVATSPAYLDCSQFSGADWGLIAQACLTALNSLNSTSGVADMRGVSNATTASINPLAQSATLPASGKMLLGAGTWLTNVPIAVHNDWSIEGISIRGVDGQVGTTIKAGASFQATYSTGSITVGTTGASEVITGSGTTWTSAMRGCAFVSPGGSSTANNTFGIIAAVNSATSISLGWGANNGSGAPAASAYDIYCPIYAAGSGGASSAGDQFGMNLSNINLDCNNVAGCVGYMNWYGNQGTRAFNVGLHGYTNIGADYEFQAQNFDESSFGAMTPGTSCTTSTIPLVVRLGAESTSGFATVSMNQCPGTVPAVGIDDQTNGLVIRNADLEHVGIGLLIGGNVTCPVACPIGPKVNVQGGVFVNVHCLAGVTTCGQISSAEGTPKNLTFIDMQATSTNMLIDGPNGNTITAGGSETTLGLYQTGEAGVVVASTSVQANAQPKTLPADAVLIANLPTAATSATAVAVVSNGSTSTDCTTGGGSNYVTCYNTGSAWVPVGGGSGGGGSPGGLTNSVQYNAGGGTFGGLNSPTSAGQYFVQFNVPGSSGVVPTASVGGVVVNAQSSATPSVTQANDTQMVQTTNSTTSTALSIPSASGLSAAFVFAHCNTGSVVATDTPTTSTVNGNPTIKLQGAVVNPSCALFWTDPSFSYWAAVIPPTDANGRISAAGMPAFTGDATTSAGSLAITVTKINGTAFAGTNGDVVSFGASNIPADSGVAVANLTTQTANGAANDVCTYTGTNKLCVPGPVTNAMLSNSSVTVNTQTCTLGSSCTITAGLAFPATVSGTATSGGIPYFSNTTTLTSSALLATNALVTGGGAGGAPATGNGDFTYATHTLTAGSSGILDLSATAPTAGLKLPSAAGAVPTADGFIGVNTTNHTLVSGSNGTTIVQAAAATGTNTATTCSNQVVTAVSAIAIPTCTTITPAYAAGNTTGSGNFVLATSATLVTPALGTPSALVLTNATGTPTSINLTNASALPCSATPALTGAVTTSAGSCATSFQSSPSFTTPNIGAATGTSLLATGIVDGEAPVTVTTGTSATLGGTYNSGYTFNEEGTAATAVTYTLPTAAAGKQYCVSNAYNGSAANTGTLELLTSASGQFIIFTDGTLSATGGFVISGGAARDAACVVGVDSTHWILYVQSGTWAKH